LNVARATPDLPVDRSVPAVLVKVGDYPMHQGSLGVLRSLGRLGVPVHVLDMRRFSPVARSRYVAARHSWSITADDDAAQFVDRLLDIGRQIGRPSVAFAGDDESAVLLAEHRASLSDRFLIPHVPADLPRRTASKRGLYEMCVAHHVPTPKSVFPATPDEAVAAGRQWGYPLIAKNVDPWTRLTSPAVGGTTLIRDERDLLRRVRDGRRLAGLLLQEFIPYEHAED